MCLQIVSTLLAYNIYKTKALSGLLVIRTDGNPKGFGNVTTPTGMDVV